MMSENYFLANSIFDSNREKKFEKKKSPEKKSRNFFPRKKKNFLSLKKDNSNTILKPEKSEKICKFPRKRRSQGKI